MGKGRRKRSKVKAKARRRSKQVPAAGPTSVNDLPDELLDVVLLDLGSSPLHLIRAAATCRRWRRAIANAGFLARSRALHGAPPVAGRYCVTDRPTPRNATGGWVRPPEKKPAAFVPSSSAVLDAGHFSLDFLYVPPVDGDRPRRMYSYNCSSRRSTRRHSRCREIIDSRGSLLLLISEPWWQYLDSRRRSPDFIVCEPVSRRYQGIARPADLSHLPLVGAFLLDAIGSGADAGAGDAMSNFRVLSVLYQRNRSRYRFCTPLACVFTPGSDGGWRICWHKMDDDKVEVPDMETIHFAGRIAGKVYWGTEDSSLLVLDESTLKFSVLTFPAPMLWPNRRTSFRRVVDGGGDTLRVVRMDGVDLEVFCQLPDSGEWVMERSISLRDATANLPGWESWFFRQSASIVTADNTSVVLTPAEQTWFFSVDLETMEVDNEHVRNRDVGPSYPCALPWPPVLRACVNHGDVTGKRRRHETAP